MNTNCNFSSKQIKDEFAYQKSLEEKSGELLTTDERWWLNTHPKYNSLLGVPILLKDTITLTPNKEYELVVKLEKQNYHDKFYADIAVPIVRDIKTDDYLLAGFELVDEKGNITKNKRVRYIQIELYKNEKSIYKIKLHSETGFLNIHYSVGFYDENNGITRISNSSLEKNNGMKRKVKGNKYIYYCKPPCEKSYNNLIFSVEINECLER